MRVSREKAAANRDRIVDAATHLFRAKGFSGGNPLDTRTAEKCDTKPPSQAGQLPGVQCGRETVVIRAVCQ